MEIATDPKNFAVKTWEIVRSRKYGSERHNTQTLQVSAVELSADKKTVKLMIPGIRPVDVMTISYSLKDAKGNDCKGTVQNTIHRLGKRG